MKFLASFKFALILIFLSALGAIVGTVLESKADSHLLAEDWIYHNPLFQILLLGYFVNILLSALSRLPFKKRHIPFLITHLGLLMLISGVFVKSRFGVQGHMQVIEGTATDDLIHMHVPALYIERRFPSGTKSIPIELLDLITYYPHAEEVFNFWDQEPLPPFVQVAKNERITTLRTKNIRDEDVAIAFNSGKLEEWIAYDKGFQGYAVQAELPHATESDKIAYNQEIERRLHANQLLSKPLELMRTCAQNALIDFPKSLIQYLKDWDQAGTWLYEIPYAADIDWKKVPEATYRALYWISELFDETQFLHHLKMNHWPLIDSLKDLEPQEQYKAWMAQIYSVQEHLPEPPQSHIPSPRMLSAYLRLFSIHYRTIPQIPFKENTITLESKLSHKILPKEPPLKKEDTTPGIIVRFGTEEIPLIFDRNKTGLKWPSIDGNHLLRFQPHREKLPYLVRLHQALDIKHPGSEQTASFECTLTLTDKRTGISTPCALQMNHVHETHDGYRFYLSGMGKIDLYDVRSIQLVVNRDPAKMILTYPGAILVALGILFLFFGRSLFR